MKVKKTLFNGLLDFILPPLCISCRSIVQEHHGLCAQCWENVTFIQPPFCDILGFPLPFDEGDKTVSAAAITMDPNFDHARSVALYDGVMRDLIHHFKYYGQMESKTIFGRWLAMASYEFIDNADLIVPVPLYRRKLFARRFNQAAILSDSLGDITGIAVERFVLKRVKDTKQQVGLSALQRRQNVGGAFAVDKVDKIHLMGKNILLIDDVYTTGSTANACAKTLKRAGAAQVDLITLARVNEPVRPLM